MLWLSCVLTATLMGFVSSHVEPIPIYAHGVGELERIPLGNLVFDETTGQATLEEANVRFEEGLYCVGAEIKDHHLQHSLSHLVFPLQNELTVTIKAETGELLDLSMSSTLSKGVTTVIKSVAKGAQVPLVTARKSQSQEGVAPSADGTTEEPEEDNRSFIQKYWMYIVPALLLVMTSGGGGGGQ